MPDEPEEMPAWLLLVNEHDGLEALSSGRLRTLPKAGGRGYSRMRVSKVFIGAPVNDLAKA